MYKKVVMSYCNLRLLPSFQMGEGSEKCFGLCCQQSRLTLFFEKGNINKSLYFTCWSQLDLGIFSDSCDLRQTLYYCWNYYNKTKVYNLLVFVYVLWCIIACCATYLLTWVGDFLNQLQEFSKISVICRNCMCNLQMLHTMLLVNRHHLSDFFWTWIMCICD